MSLVGKFAFYMGKEYHQVGQVIEEVSPCVYLVKWDKVKDVTDASPVNPMILVSITTMLERDDNGIQCWEFYQTREELDTFHEWLCTPSSKAKPESAKVSKLKLIN